MKKRIIISAMSLMIAIGSLVGCNYAKKEEAYDLDKYGGRSKNNSKICK